MEARADYVWKESLDHVFAALMPANRLVCEVSMVTGLRVGDVLALTREQVEKGRFTIQEQKTGKNRRVRLPEGLQMRILAQAGPLYAFPGRLDGKKHRTRQAVYRDLRRAAKAFRLQEHLSPHSLRKVYAVDLLAKYGDLQRVQRALNHGGVETTLIYAMADRLLEAKLSAKSGKKKRGGAAWKVV